MNRTAILFFTPSASEDADAAAEAYARRRATPAEDHDDPASATDARLSANFGAIFIVFVVLYIERTVCSRRAMQGMARFEFDLDPVRLLGAFPFHLFSGLRTGGYLFPSFPVAFFLFLLF